MKTLALCLAVLLPTLVFGGEATNAPTLKTNVVLVRPNVALTPMQSEFLNLRAANDAITAKLTSERKAAGVAYWNNDRALQAHMKQFDGMGQQLRLNQRRLNSLLHFDPSLRELPARVARAQAKLVKATNVVDGAKSDKQAEIDEAVKKFRAEQATK